MVPTQSQPSSRLLAQKPSPSAARCLAINPLETIYCVVHALKGMKPPNIPCKLAYKTNLKDHPLDSINRRSLSKLMSCTELPARLGAIQEFRCLHLQISNENADMIMKPKRLQDLMQRDPITNISAMGQCVSNNLEFILLSASDSVRGMRACWDEV